MHTIFDLEKVTEQCCVRSVPFLGILTCFVLFGEKLLAKVCAREVEVSTLGSTAAKSSETVMHRYQMASMVK